MSRPPKPASPRDQKTCDRQARVEMLKSLPARVELDTYQQIIERARHAESAEAIAKRLGLEPLIVESELERDEGLSFLTKREMNRLARGTHVPNQPLRELIAKAVSQCPDLSVGAVIRAAGFVDNSQGRRVLGYAAHADCARPPQTIRIDYAVRIARALGRAPVEVAGL